MQSGDNLSAAELYRKLAPERTPYIDRAIECAALSIPALFPKKGSTGKTKLVTPFQSIGARGVNNLASKLLLALMPPNSSFFRFMVDDYTLEELTQQEGMRAEVEEALAKIERAVQFAIESQALRVSVSEALKQLLVSGNVLLYLSEKGNGIKVFRLDRYVVQRDPMGSVLHIIVEESVSPNVLPEATRERLKALPEKGKGKNKSVCIFTHIKRTPKEWEVYQEVEGERLEGSEGTYPLDKSPWIPLRFTKVDGEDYGRGYVEEYYGDLRSLEALSQALVEGSAAASKVLFLVNPNGLTDQRTVSEAPNGAVRSGNAADVTTLQLNKYADFRVPMEMIGEISQRLAFAFLMNTAVQRGGERVTAEEIRYMAGELEDALGGVYSILSQEFQLPLVKRLVHQLEKTNKIPALPEGTVEPTITTGIEALGRGHDLNKLDVFIGGALQTLGAEQVAQYLNVGDYLTRRATALGLDTKGLIRSAEEIEAERQQQQADMQNQMLMQGGLDMASQMMKQGAVSG